jgi:D-alanine-D-alanine ligase
MESLRRFCVVVLMGGVSKEREVSIDTGRAVMKACQTLGFQDVLAFDPGREPLEPLFALRPFVAFNALHGKLGEDGCIQGFMEVLGVPLTGPPLSACALSMDKWLTKKILKASGIPVPQAVFVEQGDGINPGDVLKGSGLSFPLVVKPNQEGSSLGVTIVRSEAELHSGIEMARGFGGGVLIEEFIEGAEVQTAVLYGRVLASVEIRDK